MKILVTGSSGLLGQELIQACLAANYEVIALHRNVRDESAVLSSLPTQLICDIGDRETIKKIISASPDAVVHAAAFTDVDGCEKDPEKAWRINVVGTENVALAAEGCKAMLFYISTDYVFDGTKTSPYVESDIPNPVNVYGRSKLKGEEAVQSLCTNYFIIRTAWLFGKGRSNFVRRVVDFAKEGGDLIAWSDQMSSPTYSKDLAEAIAHMLNRICKKEKKDAGLKGLYHITNTGSCSRYEVAKEVMTYYGISNKMPRLVKLSEAGCIAPRPQMSALDNSRYSAVFGWPMRKWNDAVREYIETIS